MGGKYRIAHPRKLSHFLKIPGLEEKFKALIEKAEKTPGSDATSLDEKFGKKKEPSRRRKL